mmetsp:Transcript_19807/g.45387  ORF Transcript_19807/g.45387 Transcript_19807/m.45387 type:complete len:455 (-) Transcript_19807:74-1438(-)
MSSITVPRPITESIGSRIRVVFGSSGDEWLLLLDHDDGDAKWQVKDWKGIPSAVGKQLNNCTAKGRDCKRVDFDSSTGAWYVNGVKPDGTGGHSWWGGTEASRERLSAFGVRDVAFGCTGGGSYSSEQYVILQGKNGYCCSGLVPDDLTKRLEGIYNRGKSIEFVRLFGNNQYYVQDDEGAMWNVQNNVHLGKELKGSGPIHDVAIAGDGCWIVIRENHAVTSTGVDKSLVDKLTTFYQQQRQRFNKRKREINDAQRLIRLEREEREREERVRQEREERERQEREERERQEREMRQRQEEEEERQRVQRAKEEADKAEKERQRLEKEKLELSAATRISKLEAHLEERAIEEANDIKQMETNLSKRKRALRESLECLPESSRSRVGLDEDRRTESKPSCVICHDKEADHAVIPCGHLCLCSDCSTDYRSLFGVSQTCPLCRGIVQGTLKIYQSSG